MLQLIKCISTEEIDEIQRLAFIIWNEHYLSIIGQSQIDYMLSKNQTASAIALQIENGMVYYLVNYNGKNCGYFAYQMKDEHLFLSKLYVSNSHRGKSIASKCIDFMKEVALEQKQKQIRLAVHKRNSIALGFYHKVGFTIYQDIIQEIGEGYVMDDHLLSLEIK